MSRRAVPALLAMVVAAQLPGRARAGDIAPNIPILGVPLTVHIVRRSDGTGGMGALQLGQAIADANVAFEPMAIVFCQMGPTIFIDDDFYYFDLQTSEDYAELRQVQDVPDTINVYFTEHMGCPAPDPDDCPLPAICGLSSYPNTGTQGLVIRNACTGVALDKTTLAHELGHYFYLYHTQEQALGIECPDGSNCAFAGDKVCDTAAAPRLDTGNVDEDCQYVGVEGTCGDPYEPDPRNHMSYAPKPCRDRFSIQQAARARGMLINQREELILDPGCPVPGACALGSGPCGQPHAGPGCNDESCCESVCAMDLFCCAAQWDWDCAWKSSFACLDIAIPPWGGPDHAPLGLASVTVNPSGQLVVAGIGSSGEDGVVADLGTAGGFEIDWVDLDPAGGLPVGAAVELSALGWTGSTRPKHVGWSSATKQTGGEVHFVEIAGGAASAQVLVFDGTALVAQAVVNPAGDVYLKASFMPKGGGVPSMGPGAVSRFAWHWDAPVFIRIAGGPSAGGDRVEIHEIGGPRMERVAKVGLQAAGISEIRITAEDVDLPAGPANDDCEDPYLAGDEGVPYAVTVGGSAWYLYAAGCSGTATAAACGPTTSVTQLTVYSGDCGDLRVIGTDSGIGCGGAAAEVDFQVECGVPYLVRVTSALPSAGTLVLSCAGPCPGACPGDVQGDNAVDIVDFLLLLAAWGPAPGHLADLDGDGIVGILDFLALLAGWGDCPSLID